MSAVPVGALDTSPVVLSIILKNNLDLLDNKYLILSVIDDDNDHDHDDNYTNNNSDCNLNKNVEYDDQKLNTQVKASKRKRQYNESSNCAKIQSMCIGEIDSFQTPENTKNSVSNSSVTSELSSDQNS